MTVKTKFKEGCLTLIVTIIALVALVFIKAALCMWLWNLIVVPLLGLAVISYWQMYGLVVLIQLILPSSRSSRSK